MIAPLAKFIDWSAIQVRSLLMPPLDGQNPRLEQAIEFLKGPEFIPAESQPAPIEFKGPVHFQFTSPRPCEFAENNVVPGRIYRCLDRWREKPAIILLHGRDDFVGYQFRYPFIARCCNRSGFNAATLVAPYHFQRRPSQFQKLSRPDYLLFAKATAQAVAEIRALTGWLLDAGCPAVVLWGSSMGGWLAGLTGCYDARLATVVLTKPAVRSNPLMGALILRRSIRDRLRQLRGSEELLDLTPLNLTSIRPAISTSKILLIEGIHDLFTPPAPIEDLWRAWGRPDIWRLPHGHLSLSLMPGLTADVLQWLGQRLQNTSSVAAG